MSTTVSQDYHLLEKVYADGGIPVSLYENKITGLKVIIAYNECPIVYGDFCFATEAFDDDGLPHTLEHLVFLGSEEYPYKGVLDLLANRCLARGTNAWTDTDHTNYTVSTAGSDGFLNLLPVYLDHLLFPLLTDSGYLTEVHHINGEGEDAGVVYSEMQASENSGHQRCQLEMLKSLYPGKCGYKSETGGLMANLRTSTNNVKVRNYHKEFYHSKNLCVLVTGPVEPEAIIASIKPVEDKIIQRGLHKVEFNRPWQTPVEPLNESVRRTIQFSSDTDDDGLVYCAFRGPNVIENYDELVGLTIILDYLTETAIAPIQRDFVECAEPYCSSVSYSVIENYTSCFYFEFESVGKQYLQALTDKLFELLKKIQRGEEEMDMERLDTIISRKKVGILSTAETSAHDIITGPAIGHFLYGRGPLGTRAQVIPVLDKYAQCSNESWLDLIHQYMTGPEARHVCIVGEPSPSLMKSMAEAEKQRLDEQKKVLKDKLQSLADDLKKAMDENDRPAPLSMLTSVPIPSIDNIKFHSIERVVVSPEAKCPIRIQYDSIKTNFITINLIMNTSQGPTKHDRLHLPLLTELITECPIMRNGELIPYEKVVAELFSDTVSYGAGVGLSSASSCSVGQISMIFGVAMQVEVEKYNRAVRWFHELLYQTVFTVERIKTVATKLVSEISQYKRSGNKVAGSAVGALLYHSNSNQWASNFMRQQKFLKKLLKDLKDDPDSVQRNITRIRDMLVIPNNMLVHIALNTEKIDVNKIHEPWLSLVPEEVLKSSPGGHIEFDDIVKCHTLVNAVPSPKAAIIGVGSVESNYMHQLVKSINSIDHPDLAAVHVLNTYLTQLEGPLWRQIRGAGLSYHYTLNLNSSEGLMALGLTKSTQLVDAYSKMGEVIGKFVAGKEDFDEILFDSAKASLIFELIRREKSPAGKSVQSLVAYLQKLDVNYNRELITKVMRVTQDDLRRVGPLYLKPLFEDPERRTVVCCNPSKVEEITKGLAAKDCHLEPLSLEKDSFWNSIE